MNLASYSGYIGGREQSLYPKGEKPMTPQANQLVIYCFTEFINTASEKLAVEVLVK